MIRKKILTNGLTILTEKMPNVQSVAVGIWLKRGSRHEEEQESGLAHFIEHMVFKGTNTRTQAQIAQEMDAIGGQIDAFTSQEYVGFHAQVLSEDLPHAANLLSDIVLEPRFDIVDLEHERLVILEEIKSLEDCPEELVHEIFSSRFWPNHSLGRSILGNPQTICDFKRDDVTRFFKKTYTPTNIIVVAAGKLDHTTFQEIVESKFSNLQMSSDGLTNTAPNVVSTIYSQEKDLEQAHIVVGTIAPASASSSRFAAYVLNAVLGGNLSSRLFQVIREDRGLAYTVHSSISSYHDCGQFTVYAGTDPKNIKELVTLTMEEIGRIKAEPISTEELLRAKAYFRSSLLMSLESPGARMSHAARQEIDFGQHIEVKETLNHLEKVEAKDVCQLATDMFGERQLAMAILGKNKNCDFKPEMLVA